MIQSISNHNMSEQRLTSDHGQSPDSDDGRLPLDSEHVHQRRPPEAGDPHQQRRQGGYHSVLPTISVTMKHK